MPETTTEITTETTPHTTTQKRNILKKFKRQNADNMDIFDSHILITHKFSPKYNDTTNLTHQIPIIVNFPHGFQ